MDRPFRTRIMPRFLNLLLLQLLAAACAFSPSRVVHLRQRPLIQRVAAPFAAPSSSSSSSSSAASSLVSSEIFLVAFDGIIAPTIDYRIDVGIDLAFATWPHLHDLEVIAGAAKTTSTSTNNVNTSRHQHEWLRNKMKALSHVMVSRPNVSLSCDYALLARLLMEEQELDGGKSKNRGKYGSQFHPEKAAPSTAATTEDSSAAASSSPSSSSSTKRQTRPLTVGEIAVNWNKGGCLGETVLSKYHVHYKNPLPILQEKLEELLLEKEYEVPKVSEAALDALENSAGNVILTVGHHSDLAMAQTTLSCAKTSIPIEFQIVAVDDENLLHCNSVVHSDTPTLVKLLPIVGSTNESVYSDILKRVPSGSTVYVFESSWQALEESIPLFGDNIPRGNRGMARTYLERDDVMLSLNFPSWCSPVSSSSSSQNNNGSGSTTFDDGQQGEMSQPQNNALMNTWTNLVTELEFSELLSARIVSSP